VLSGNASDPPNRLRPGLRVAPPVSFFGPAPAHLPPFLFFIGLCASPCPHFCAQQSLASLPPLPSGVSDANSISSIFSNRARSLLVRLPSETSLSCSSSCCRAVHFLSPTVDGPNPHLACLSGTNLISRGDLLLPAHFPLTGVSRLYGLYHPDLCLSIRRCCSVPMPNVQPGGPSPAHLTSPPADNA